MWSGSYPYKRGAKDKSVRDAESAFIHEFYAHLLPGARAAKAVLEKFEQKTFNSDEACRNAIPVAIKDAQRAFSRAAQRNPL